jgi:hypothetical protein
VNHETILLHPPAYRDPELVPTIRSALAQAMHPNDGFDNLGEYRADSRFHGMDVLY